MGVQGPDVDAVAQNGDATVHTTAAGRDIGGIDPTILPQHLAGACFKGGHVAWGLADVHNAAADNGRHFKLVCLVDLVGPQRLQAACIRLGDLRQR